MDQEVKPENNIRRHISRLHERIQNKYAEMQKKLEKSKSLGSISNLSDDFNSKESIYSSEVDLRDADSVFTRESAKTETVIVEEVQRQSSTSQEIEFIIEEYIEASFVEIENEGLSDKENEVEEEIVEKILEKTGRNYIEIHKNSTSLESLTDIGIKDANKSHRTIRQRINSRLNAAKERRKREEKEKLLKEKLRKELMLTNTKQDTRPTRKNKIATVTIALIEATGLEHTDDRVRLLHCRLRLGHEKAKSKTAKSKKSGVKWQELFNINMYGDDPMLEVSMFEKDNFVGRHTLDLTDIEKEKTHKMRLDLEGGEMAGVRIFILLTVTGISSLNSLLEIEDIETVKRNLHRRKDVWGDFSDVGRLSVVVYGAKGLIAQDCYCVLKLGNERLQTHTEYKTNEPNWMKMYIFEVHDITSILEVTVIEEKKTEEVGKISIPLLRIHNDEKVWYALKDSTQRDRAKGHNPRILLEMSTSWNLLKASIRVINPKEEDLLQIKKKLDRRLFAKNLARARVVISWVLDALSVIKTCFEWESRRWNAIALFLWIVFCWNFKMWMTPLLLLIPFVKYRPEKYYLIPWGKRFLKESERVEVAKIEKDEKTSLIQKLNSLTDMVQSVQNGIGMVASLGESIKNLCNFTVPYVSLLAVFLILVITLFMYIIPLKFIFIGWGIHKFTRKILRPNRIPNSEILDLLSRVPDDETLLDCEELPLELQPEEDKI